MRKELKGKKTADVLKKEIILRVKKARAVRKDVPRLCCIQLKKDAAFSLYPASLIKVAAELGIEFVLKDASGKNTAQLKRQIREINEDPFFDGVIIQRPFPARIPFKKIAPLIDPKKDIEGVTPYNLGMLFCGIPLFVSPTALSAFTLAKRAVKTLRGKEVVIVGHSALVGKPLAALFLSELATVSVCHIGTYEKGFLRKHVERADILCVAVGKAHVIKGSWVAKGSVVIDVGVNKRSGKLVGDVEFNTAYKRAARITPVPGGVGPLTTAFLFKNVIRAFSLKKEGEK